MLQLQDVHVSTTGIAGCKDGGDQTTEEDSEQDFHHHGNDSDDDNETINVMELDVELEDDLCKLWDASINEVRNAKGKMRHRDKHTHTHTRTHTHTHTHTISHLVCTHVLCVTCVVTRSFV